MSKQLPLTDHELGEIVHRAETLVYVDEEEMVNDIRALLALIERAEVAERELATVRAELVQARAVLAYHTATVTWSAMIRTLGTDPNITSQASDAYDRVLRAAEAATVAALAEKGEEASGG